MNVSTKMMLTYMLAGVLLFGTYGIYTMRTEERALREVLEQNTMLLGTSVRVAVENALRDGQLADVVEIVEEVERPYQDVVLAVFDSSGMQIPSPLTGRAPHDLIRSAAEIVTSRHEPVTHYLTFASGEEKRLVVGFPLIDDDGSYLGHLAVIRTLDAMKQDLRDTRSGILLLIVAFMATTTAIAYVVGYIYVHRPLNRLIDAISRLRDGAVPSRVGVKQRDEIGRLSDEFNSMFDDLSAARNELERKEGERRDLLLTLQRADKLVTVGQLSAGLAHEIGSPLQVLSGRARDMLDYADNPEDVRRNAAILVSQTERIVMIVEQLLQLSRKRKSLMKAIDLSVPVRQVVDLLQFESRQKGVELSTKIAEDLPRVHADPDQMQQVLVNLIINALEATPRGGRIDVAVERSAIVSPDGSSVDAVALSVTDTGLGMTEEVKVKVFDPFFTTRGEQGGTGLGLAIVQAIVNDHDGRVALDSHVGLGSRFVITLPSLEQSV